MFSQSTDTAGTGGYGSVAGKQPECWWDICDNGKLAEDSMLKWLELGGRRLDDATSYYHQKATGRVMKKTSVPREEIFYVSKVGPSDPLGKLYVELSRDNGVQFET